MRPTIIGRVVVERDGRRGWWSQRWVLRAPLEVKFYGLKVSVPPGTVTDFASVPAPLKLLFPAKAIFSAASVVHDWLYQRGVTSKWMADALFFSLLRHEGVCWVVRALMWVGVWLGGWFAWWGHRRAERSKDGGR